MGGIAEAMGKSAPLNWPEASRLAGWLSAIPSDTIACNIAQYPVNRFRPTHTCNARGDVSDPSFASKPAMASASRQTGLSILGDMLWGTHFCLFYETKQDLLDTLVPYFKAGLESNEFCMWAISEPLTIDEVRTALSQAIPNFERYLAAQSVEIIPGREWYLTGDEFDLQRITGGWHDKLRAALAKGYEGMRVSGNAFWLQTDYRKDFLQYEQELNEVVGGERMIALCTYPLTASRAADVLEVADAHQFTAARRRGEWEIIRTVDARGEAHSLTPRQLEVLGWVARGKSAWEIGEILQITKRTVDEHVQTAVRKLGTVNRTQAVAVALRDGIIEWSPALPRR